MDHCRWMVHRFINKQRKILANKKNRVEPLWSKVTYKPSVEMSGHPQCSVCYSEWPFILCVRHFGRHLTSPAECGCAKISVHVRDAILDYKVHNSEQPFGEGGDAVRADMPQSVGERLNHPADWTNIHCWTRSKPEHQNRTRIRIKIKRRKNIKILCR